MYFVFSGNFVYYHGISDIATGQITKDQWCSEPPIWVKWKHHGRLAAVTHCEFASLDASCFRRVLSNRADLFLTCQKVALHYQRFCTRILEQDDNPLDIWCDHDAWIEISQTAFELHEWPEHQPGIWRLMHSFSLRIKRKSQPAFKKSNSI